MVELLEAKTETFGPLGDGGGRGDDVPPPRPARVWQYGLRRVCAAWGMARSSTSTAMTSGQHAEQPHRQRRSGTEARDLGPGAAGGDRSRPGGGRPGMRRGLPTRALGSASGLSRHPGCIASGWIRLMRENNLLSPHSLPPPWRSIPMTVPIDHSCPEPHVGHRWRQRVWITVDDGWGWIFTARRALERHSAVGWHVCKRRM